MSANYGGSAETVVGDGGGCAPTTFESREIQDMNLGLDRDSDVSNSDAPFAEILSRLTERALLDLRKRCGPVMNSVLTAYAVDDLRRGLLEELSGIARHALLYEYNLHRYKRDTMVAVRLSTLTGRPEKQVYDGFIRAVTANAGALLFERYPVLDRLISERISFWQKNTTRLIRAFSRDRSALVREFGFSADAVIHKISMNLSDSHNQGQTVAILTFNCGARVVYKPRCLDLEIGFMRILSYLNRVAQEPLFGIIGMVGRRTHGWCEFIEHKTTDSETAVRSFYRRTGNLLAALYAFRATDCHFENLIARDGYPFVVDLETLCHPNHGFGETASFDTGPETYLYDSVCRVGLLPVIRGGTEVLDLSALGAGLEPQETVVREYSEIGSAAMNITDRVQELPCSAAMPSVTPLGQAELVSALCEGFEEAYLLIVKEREVLLSDSALVPALTRCRSRFIARPTKLYAWLLLRSLNFSSLHDEANRSVELDRLAKIVSKSSQDSPWYDIVNSERASLEQLDIPHFTTRMNSRSLWAGKKRLHTRALQKSPKNLLMQRLNELSPLDLSHQLQIIELSFAQKNLPIQEERGRPIHRLSRSIDLHQICSVVDDIARQLMSLGLHGTHRTVSWIGLGPTGARGTYRLQPCGRGLCGGTAGIALFFAAAAKVLSNSSYRSLALDILHQKTIGERKGEVMNVDLGEGSAGIAYALVRAGELLKEKGMTRKAEELLLSIPDGMLSTMQNSDVTSGLAGILLSMNALARIRDSADLRRKMVLIADRLLSLEIPIEPGVGGWATLDYAILPGFAHGSAGIAWSLDRSAELLGIQRFSDAARRGFRNTQRLFDTPLRNWRDPRPQMNGGVIPCSWCHGAIGIGLALGESARVDEVERAQVREQSISIVESDCALGSRIDSLCCGVTGALELLSRGPFDHRTDALKSGCVEYLCETRHFRYLPDNGSRVPLPGLFIGAAGVGYHLLRAGFPAEVPPLLLFE